MYLSSQPNVAALLRRPTAKNFGVLRIPISALPPVMCGSRELRQFYPTLKLLPLLSALRNDCSGLRVLSQAIQKGQNPREVEDTSNWYFQTKGQLFAGNLDEFPLCTVNIRVVLPSGILLVSVFDISVRA